MLLKLKRHSEGFWSVSSTTALRRAMRCMAARVASDDTTLTTTAPSSDGETLASTTAKAAPDLAEASTATVDRYNLPKSSRMAAGTATPPKARRIWKVGRPDNSTSGLLNVNAPSSALRRNEAEKPTLLF